MRFQDLLAIIVSVGVLAGCGGGGGNDSATTSTVAAANPTASPTPVSATGATPTPVPVNTPDATPTPTPGSSASTPTPTPTPTPAPSAATLNPADTSVQMFQWSWNDLATECTTFLGPQGYGAIQISPPSASLVAPNWWAVYQPVSYALTSRFGTQAQLQAMINACHAAGVRVYADIVANQMAGSASAVKGVATDGSSWDAGTLTYPGYSANDFHAACDIQQTDYDTSQAHVQTCRLNSMPDLNSESSYVRSHIAGYMNSLLALGIDGFRIDAAKHQSAASLQAIMALVKAAHPTTNLGEPIWVTQEVVPDGEVVRADYYAVGTLNEFDFTWVMRDAWRNANGLTPASIPTVMGTSGQWGGTWYFLQPQHATVFVTNWDTERELTGLTADNGSGATNDAQGNHRYELANIFMLAQAYGEAQLFSGFRFSNKDQDRPSASPYLNGVAQINVNWDFFHRWSDIAPMVRFRAATRNLAQSNWVTGNNNQIAFSRGGVGFVALNNTSTAWSRTFYTGLPRGTYCNIVHGLKNPAGTACASDTVSVDASGNATVTVVADGGSVVPAVAIYTGQMLAQ